MRQKYANAEDGKARGMGEDASISFGIRMLAGEMSAWGTFWAIHRRGRIQPPKD